MWPFIAFFICTTYGNSPQTSSTPVPCAGFSESVQETGLQLMSCLTDRALRESLPSSTSRPSPTTTSAYGHIPILRRRLDSLAGVPFDRFLPRDSLCPDMAFLAHDGGVAGAFRKRHILDDSNPTYSDRGMSSIYFDSGICSRAGSER